MPLDLAELVAPHWCAVVTWEVRSGTVGEHSALPELGAAAGPTVEAVARLCAATREAGAALGHGTVARRADDAHPRRRGHLGPARPACALPDEPRPPRPGDAVAALADPPGDAS